ncbi:putative ubiquitin-like protein YukD [Aquimarina sp. EL_43]|uniref:hypothetical protein n=1 Tax=Aquimarina TaxID=290174 RepID=UPI000472F373|nr:MULTISPECIES: hypothetical protein [Aquimarina]MBG6129658.1 putative ubiquitin-like protein YukD [Aquimarina sp. EL_35]MBG6150723.1 putative ubiquitin-like protein YukD [Aquimarina sp. EL_32]MBG6167970.1 putative ubiquitin-like protein YukD [Aquimarina sp. EL_43]
MSNPIKNDKLIKQYDLELGKVFFYVNYLIIEVAEGVCFDYEKAKTLSLLTNLHFGNRSFGYISHRINSYSLEATDYMKIKDVFPNIKAFAAVTYNETQKTSIRIENMFYQEGIVSFENIEEAIRWVTEQLKNDSST